VINYKLSDKENGGDFGEGFAELIKRRTLSEKPIPV